MGAPCFTVNGLFNPTTFRGIERRYGWGGWHLPFKDNPDSDVVYGGGYQGARVERHGYDFPIHEGQG